ncbi:MAG: hypothetical protein AAFX53_10400 [Bacteroidota bacterium]
MKKRKEFYIGYVDGAGTETKKTLRNFVSFALLFLVLGGFLFAYFQQPASSSFYDFGNPTKVVGTYHESPYPMLRVQLAENEFKEIVMLGFGKSGANPFLDEAREKEGDLIGGQLTIEGQLIYYNGKTLLEIDDGQKISVTGKGEVKSPISLGNIVVQGEVIDPKCYFGVMKPGYGKIHRSCAALCISGGIPPVLVSQDENGTESYFLLTDVKGNAIHKDIIPYIGQPSRISGDLPKLGDWDILKVDVAQIEKLDKTSSIY